MIREIMLFLHSHGVGTSRAVRIFKTYGADAVQVISENPYRLARDIRGIGFKSADLIAMRLGIEKTAMIRARAGISYALAEAMDDGHCGLPVDELRELAAALLEIAPEVVDAAIALERAEVSTRIYVLRVNPAPVLCRDPLPCARARARPAFVRSLMRCASIRAPILTSFSRSV